MPPDYFTYVKEREKKKKQERKRKCQVPSSSYSVKYRQLLLVVHAGVYRMPGKFVPLTELPTGR